MAMTDTETDTEKVKLSPTEDSQLLQSHQKQRLRWRTLLPLMGFTFVFYIGTIGWVTLMPQYVLARFREDYSDNSTAIEGDKCNINTSDPLYLKEKELERLTSQVSSVSAFCTGVPAILVVLIYSSISDQLGRKVTLAIPYVGGSLVAVTIACLVIFRLPFWVLYIANFINGFSGSYSTLIAGLCASVADVTPKKRRSIAIGIVEGSLGLAMLVANLLAGVWATNAGFTSVILFLSAMIVSSGVFFFFIQETRPHRDLSLELRLGVLASIKKQLNHMAAALFLDRQRAKKIFLLTGGFALTQLAYAGSLSVTTLYVMGQPFCWNPSQIGFFNAFRVTLIMVGSTVGLVVLRKRMSDFTLTIIGTLSYIAFNVMAGIASLLPSPMQNVMIIIGVPVSLMSTVQLITLRALCSNVVTDSEQGAIFGLIAIGDVFSTSFGPVIMNSIYAAVVTTMSWFVFFICVILLVILLVLLAIYKCSLTAADYANMDDRLN